MSNLLQEYRRLTRAQNRWWIIAAALLAGGELFFGIAERAVGRYLVWQNSSRQKIGRSWEAAESRVLADTRLEQTQQEIRQRSGNLASLENFEQVLQFVQSNQRAVLPLSQFATVYRAVPEVFQPLLVPAETLLKQVGAGRAVSALCAYDNGALEIFLLDAEDRSVHQSRLSAEQLRLMARHGGEQQLDVARTERFAQQVFAPEVFYEAVDDLPAAARAWLLQQLPILTEPENRFARVAISNQTTDGFVEIAFVISTYRCRIYFLPEAWVDEHLWSTLNEDRFIKFE